MPVNDSGFGFVRNRARATLRRDPVTATVAATAISGGAQAFAAKQAADAQEAAAKRSAEVQREALEQTREDLRPFRQIGVTAAQDLGFLGGETAKGAQFDQAQQALDGVQGAVEDVGQRSNQLAQFLANRGQQAQFLKQDPVFQAIADETSQQLKQSQAAQGRLQSGETPELLQENLLEKGQSLINARQNQLSGATQAERQDLQANQAGFQAALGAQEQRFNQLFDLTSLGESAAARSGQASQRGAGQIGQALIQAGEADASGTVGAANALSGGLQAGAQAFGASQRTQQLFDILKNNRQQPSTLPSQGGGGVVDRGAVFGGAQPAQPGIFNGRGGGTNAATGSKSGLL